MVCQPGTGGSDEPPLPGLPVSTGGFLWWKGENKIRSGNACAQSPKWYFLFCICGLCTDDKMSSNIVTLVLAYF